ncbi:hypothetical protein [Cupriavidus sp. DL-D2]|uniref:hypothetical protein n=1 Tax=Cupriavidus sp. DL-D2 TaxID=3144974 RepID=UPI0032145A5A
MKAITEPKRERRATNCTGPDEWFTVQRFEVEASDAGSKKPNYLGHRHREYAFDRRDVGKKIEVITQPGYECWGFLA